METKVSLAVWVGIFVLVGVIMLLGLSLRVEKELFRKPEGMEIQANFADVKGLDEGAPVRLAGLDVGNVKSMHFDPAKGMVDVMLFIRSPYHLKTDSVASIRLHSLLGQYYIGIEFGDPEAGNLQSGGVVKTGETMDVNQALEVLGDAGKEIKSLAAGFNKSQEKLTTILDENRDNIRKTTESFASIGPKMETALDSFNDLLAGLKTGKGTIGKLFEDESLYKNLSSASDNITSITSDIRMGKGTLSQLIYSDDLLVRSRGAIDEIQQAAGKVNTLLTDNSDRIGHFFTSMDKIGPHIETAVQNISEISDKINKGEGTLGKMVTDPSLYDDTKGAVKQIKASFEESEEQSVVRTVLSLIIGPVM